MTGGGGLETRIIVSPQAAEANSEGKKYNIY